jgi:hypothetical protein
MYVSLKPKKDNILTHTNAYSSIRYARGTSMESKLLDKPKFDIAVLIKYSSK